MARDAIPTPEIEPVTNAERVVALRAALDEVHVAAEVSDYAVRLVRATRESDAIALADSASGTSPVSLGGSPRASIFLVRAARARALLDGRGYATPHDVKRMAPDVLRHRLILTYEAEADGITPESVIRGLLDSVETP